MAAPTLRTRFLWLPVVVAALLLVYLPGLGHPLVFDDDFLASGELFALYDSALPLRERMLSYGSFVWLQALFGEGWWKQRLANLALHVATVIALWALYREILRAIQPPEAEAVPYHLSPALGVAMGFFALNPVAVYAVAYLIQRSILMATLFVVLALWLFALGLSRRRPLCHVLALVAYVLALASKEHAILAPLAAVPLYVVIARPGIKRMALLGAAGGVLVAVAGAALLARYGEILGKPFDEYSQVYVAQLAALSPDAERNAYGLSVLNQAYLFFHYGLRWLLPWESWLSINLRPVFPVSWLTFPHVLGIAGYAAVLVGGFFLVIRYRDLRALLGLSILMPALLFATEFVTVWVQDPFVLYRSYLWAIGVPGVVFLLLHGPSPSTLAGIALVAGSLLIWQSLDRVFSMASPERVWTDAIRKLPDDARAVGRWFPYLNRGSVYVDQNELTLAMRDFQSSAALGDLGMGAMNLGAVLSALGRHREALEQFDRAEREGYRLYNLPFQRAQALLALGQPAEAVPHFQKALRLGAPAGPREAILLHLARISLHLQRPADAAAALDELLAREPRHNEGRYLRAMVHVMSGRHQEARALLDGLLADEKTGRGYYARALANYGLKRKADALSDIETAIRMGPDDPNLRAWHARIRSMP